MQLRINSVTFSVTSMCSLSPSIFRIFSYFEYMKENATTSEEFVKGFNDGYLLAKHEPELVARLPVDLGSSERSKGFKAGKEQYLLEKSKERLPAWMRADRLSNLDKNDVGKDKDELEKE